MKTRKKLVKAINAFAQTLQTEQRLVDEHKVYVKTYLQNHLFLFSGMLISAGLIGWLSGKNPRAPRLFKQVGRVLWLTIPKLGAPLKSKIIRRLIQEISYK